MARKCIRCGQPATSSRHWYCDRCAELPYETRLGKRKPRANRYRSRQSYGHKHRLERKKWEPIVAAGRALCSRCRKPIIPGTPWDLGHDDNDRSRYTGPEHASCNRATSTHRKERRRWRPAS